MSKFSVQWSSDGRPKSRLSSRTREDDMVQPKTLESSDFETRTDKSGLSSYHSARPDATSEMSDIRTVPGQPGQPGQMRDEKISDGTLEHEFQPPQQGIDGGQPGLPPPVPPDERRSPVPPGFDQRRTPSAPPGYQSRAVTPKDSLGSGTYYSPMLPTAREEVRDAELKRASESRPSTVEPSGTPGPQPGEPGYQPQPGEPGYQPQPGELGYQPQPGEPGYQPQPGEPGYQPQPGEPGYQPQPGEPGYQPQPGELGATPQPQGETPGPQGPYTPALRSVDDDDDQMKKLSGASVTRMDGIESLTPTGGVTRDGTAEGFRPHAAEDETSDMRSSTGGDDIQRLSGASGSFASGGFGGSQGQGIDTLQPQDQAQPRTDSQGTAHLYADSVKHTADQEVGGRPVSPARQPSEEFAEGYGQRPSKDAYGGSRERGQTPGEPGTYPYGSQPTDRKGLSWHPDQLEVHDQSQGQDWSKSQKSAGHTPYPYDKTNTLDRSGQQPSGSQFGGSQSPGYQPYDQSRGVDQGVQPSQGVVQTPYTGEDQFRPHAAEDDVSDVRSSTAGDDIRKLSGASGAFKSAYGSQEGGLDSLQPGDRAGAASAGLVQTPYPYDQSRGQGQPMEGEQQPEGPPPAYPFEESQGQDRFPYDRSQQQPSFQGGQEAPMGQQPPGRRCKCSFLF